MRSTKWTSAAINAAIKKRSAAVPAAVPSASSGQAAGAASSPLPKVLLTLGVLFLALLVSATPPEKHLSIYSTAANYSLPIIQRHGHDYVGLLELLDPLGKV